MQLFDSSEHIRTQTFDALHKNRLTEDERADVFAHIAACDTCSEHYAESFEGLLQPAPRALVADIRHAVFAKKKHRTLIWYNVKIGFAVFASVLFLFVCTPADAKPLDFDPMIHRSQNHESYGSETIDNIRENMRIFSEKLLFGGLQNEKTKK